MRLWCPYGDPTELLLECRVAAFVLTMRTMHRLLVFYVTPQCLLAMPLRCCGDACDHTAGTLVFCIILGRYGMAMRPLLWCDRGLRTREQHIGQPLRK